MVKNNRKKKTAMVGTPTEITPHAHTRLTFNEATKFTKTNKRISQLI